MKNADGFSTSPINFTTLSWDCLGAEKFIALVSTVMAGSALTTATLQAKLSNKERWVLYLGYTNGK